MMERYALFSQRLNCDHIFFFFGSSCLCMYSRASTYYIDFCLTIQVVAVKKINSSALSNSDDFLEIVSEISRLHHPNVTELVGYCSEHGQYLLIYEFHKNGSLHEFLHLSDEFSKPLTWNTRVKIALGTARALE